MIRQPDSSLALDSEFVQPSPLRTRTFEFFSPLSEWNVFSIIRFNLKHWMCNVSLQKVAKLWWILVVFHQNKYLKAQNINFAYKKSKNRSSFASFLSNSFNIKCFGWKECLENHSTVLSFDYFQTLRPPFISFHFKSKRNLRICSEKRNEIEESSSVKRTTRGEWRPENSSCVSLFLVLLVHDDVG